MSDYRDNNLELQLVEVTADMAYEPEFPDAVVAGITADEWGNEWDGGADFSDIDFRTVDH